MLRSIFSGLAVSGLALSVALPALAQSVEGVWLRPKTGGHIEAFACNGGIGLKVVKSKKTQLVGRVLMCGAQATAPGTYFGQLRNAENGRTYSGRVTVQGRKLLLRGCLMNGVACRSETWRRLR